MSAGNQPLCKSRVIWSKKRGFTSFFDLILQPDIGNQLPITMRSLRCKLSILARRCQHLSVCKGYASSIQVGCFRPFHRLSHASRPIHSLSSSNLTSHHVVGFQQTGFHVSCGGHWWWWWWWWWWCSGGVSLGIRLRLSLGLNSSIFSVSSHADAHVGW